MDRTGAATDEWPLVGRDEELTLLGAAVDRPEGGCAVVVGGAGVGKSRLGRILLDRAAATGARTERITGTRSAATMPLAAVLGLLPDEEAEAGELLELFRRIRRALAAPAGQARPFLFVDDGHLLDPSSAALVHHLVLNRAVDAVVTVRSGEPVPDAITALWRDELGERIELQPLGVDDVGRLLGRVLGGRVDDGTAARLWKVTGGNPLFLREVVRESLQRDELERQDGVWTWAGHVAIGARLRELVAAPLADLDGAERAVLDLLAVGETLPARLLEHAADPGAVAGARRRGLVVAEPDDAGRRDDDGLRLHHPVLGEVLRADLTGPARARLAGQLVAGVAATGVEIDRLRLATWHLDAGSADDADLLADAATRAFHRFDPPLAERLARAALDAGAGPEAGLVLGRALDGQGRHAEAAAVLLPIAETGSDDVMVAAATVLSDAVCWGLNRPDEADATLVALATDERSDDARRHLLALRAAIKADTGDVAAALELVTPWAWTPAPGVSDSVRLQAVTAAGLALSMSGRTEAALAMCDDLLGPALAVAAVAPRHVGRVLGQRVLALVLGARLDEAELLMDAAHALAVAEGNDEMQAGAALVLGQIALERGRLTTADERLREAAVLLRRHDPQRYLPWCLALLARTAGQAGDPTTAAEAAEEAERWAAVSPVHIYDAQVAVGRAWALAAGGERSAARAIALAAAEDAVRSGNRMMAAITFDAALRFDAPPGPVAARLAELPVDGKSPWVPALLAHAEGLAADDGERLDQAADRLEALGALLRAAEASAAAADAYGRSGHRSSAQRARGRAARLLAACPGVAPAAASASATPPAGLTRREHEIASLAAAGLSNAEIADRLTVSVRTVEGHLLRASTKLGVRRRVDLAGALGSGPGDGADTRNA